LQTPQGKSSRSWSNWRRSPAVAATVALVLLVVGVGMALYGERSYRAQKGKEVSVQAEILAAIMTAALAFNDHDAAQEYINALRANPDVRAAAVYDASGALFASYARAGAQPMPARMAAQEPQLSGNQLIVTRPVVQGGSRLGMVYIETVLEPLERRIVRYGVIALLAAMTTLVVAVLVIAHSELTKANAELEARARALAEANASLQAQIEERQKAEEALRQAQKMETIGQLTGGVAHDFNNILTVIMGNLDRLQRRLAGGGDLAEARRAAENAQQGARRAAALTQSLLAFSRRQPLDPKPVDANRLVANMSDLLHRTLGEQITVETVIAGGLWRTHIDPNHLENAILNLAINARDAMPDGGKLTIETANAHLDERYAAQQAEVAPGQYVVLCISDTGAGMSREVIEQAFEPFFTTKDVGHGTGLGLSQVYGFVKQSGGHVKIYSEVGQGTAVKIYLPRFLADEEPEEEAPPAGASLGAASAELVLVVEDDEAVRAHSVEILRELGYRVLEAANARTALELLERQPEIALLFTDVGLPGGMNGRQLAEAAVRARPTLKVLFTTGYARNAIVHDGRLDAGVRLITKPFSYDELGAAVRDVLARRALPPCILIVEDETLVRMMAVEAAEELGFRVEQAANAAQALRKVRLANGGIDAAVIDVGLPDRAGDALAAELRASHARMPVILATGYGGDDLRARFAADPLVSFLGKPYHAADLEARLRAAGIHRPHATR
jgi:signal transduction histidine kinase/DNA-binding response OmpR family regulator